MKTPIRSLIAATCLSFALIAAVSIAPAQDAPQANPANSAAGDNSSQPGQVLEIPPSNASEASARSMDSGSAADSSDSDLWSDGTNTYVWRNKSPSADTEVEDEAAPAPSYAGVDEYMNQQAEAEAMGSVISPMAGVPVPLLSAIDPFLFYGVPLERSFVGVPSAPRKTFPHHGGGGGGGFNPGGHPHHPGKH